MISQTPSETASPEESAIDDPPFCTVLGRYGAAPQVARFGVSELLHADVSGELVRGVEFVAETDRGPELITLLEIVRQDVIAEEKPVTGQMLRLASDDDRKAHRENRQKADVEFFDWQQRLADWQLQLQLIDLEWTLDQQQIILYVLNGQDAETTRLALLAAAAGLGIIHVQPVAAEGVIQATGGGGCGSGGCGSGGCG